MTLFRLESPLLLSLSLPRLCACISRFFCLWLSKASLIQSSLLYCFCKSPIDLHSIRTLSHKHRKTKKHPRHAHSPTVTFSVEPAISIGFYSAPVSFAVIFCRCRPSIGFCSTRCCSRSKTVGRGDRLAHARTHAHSSCSGQLVPRGAAVQGIVSKLQSIDSTRAECGGNDHGVLQHRSTAIDQRRGEGASAEDERLAASRTYCAQERRTPECVIDTRRLAEMEGLPNAMETREVRRYSVDSRATESSLDSGRE